MSEELQENVRSFSTNPTQKIVSQNFYKSIITHDDLIASDVTTSRIFLKFENFLDFLEGSRKSEGQFLNTFECSQMF